MKQLTQCQYEKAIAKILAYIIEQEAFAQKQFEKSWFYGETGPETKMALLDCRSVIEQFVDAAQYTIDFVGILSSLYGMYQSAVSSPGYSASTYYSAYRHVLAIAEKAAPEYLE